MKSAFVEAGIWEAILTGMTPANARAIAVSLETGMRLGDVLKINVCDLAPNGINYVAQKTGKASFAKCSEKLLELLHVNAVNGVCFPSAFGAKTPYRTRQAVWRDVRRAAKNAGIKAHVTPHGARKTFAVDLRRKSGIEAVREALQHSSQGVTNLYAFADVQNVEYDRDRITTEAAAKVLRWLAENGLLPKSPNRLDIVGEDDL